MPLTIFFPDAGTFTIDDDGIRGNGISVIRDATGAVILTFAHPADTMAFSVLTTGVNLVFNTLDSFGTASVTVGSLTSAAQSPDSIVVHQIRTDAAMTLVSNGSITEGAADSPADIVAGNLTLSAATGIGTAANALETQVTFIEGETITGGINIANFGVVQIGGITANVEGLDVTTSGDLTFSTTGFIVLNDTSGPEQVHGGDISGNVTLTALGADADIFTNIDRRMVSAAGGGITLTAGRDVAAGTAGANFNNDLLATGDITINAGRDFLLDGTSNVRTGAFGGVVGGNVVITAGRNINLTNTTGGLQTIEAFNGNITLTTGPGGTYFQNTAFAATVQTTNDIFLNADNVVMFSGGLNTTGIGQITVRPVTPGRAIDVGSGTDLAAALSLSDSELDRFFTLNVAIGDENSGPVEISAALTPFIVASLVVRSATEILVGSSITLSGSSTSLLLQAGHDVFQLASSTISVDNLTVLVDTPNTDAGVGGNGIFNGTFATATNTINGNSDADTLNGNAAANILLGLGGNDTLRGFGGADWLDGGTGADVLRGGLGNDTMLVDNVGDIVFEAAGEGNDNVRANILNYTLPAGASVELLSTTANGGTGIINLIGNELGQAIVGNAGQNNLVGGGGDDALVGLGGNDVLFVDFTDSVFEDVGGGNDHVQAFTSFVLTPGAEVELLSTTSNAGAANLNLTGNEFGQAVVGNAGGNVLDGKGGQDALVGLGGADAFTFTTALGAGNVDQIIDMTAGTDKIYLDNAIFATLADGALAAGAFRTGAAAADADDRIIYNSATGALFYDADGNGAGAQVQFASLSTGLSLSATDFLVI